MLGMDPSLKFVAQLAFFPPVGVYWHRSSVCGGEMILKSTQFKFVDRRDRGGTMQ